MSRTHISSGIMSRMRVFESAETTAAASDSPKHSTKLLVATPLVSAPPAAPNDDDQCGNNSAADEHIIIQRSEQQNERTTTMMMSSPPHGVQTDADGLILPKKLINPCLESTDRKQLHRELKFNTKIGKSVLNQKTELQRAYEKQRERQQQQQQQQLQQTQDHHSPTAGLKGELSRVIMERAQKHERHDPNVEDEDDKQYVNPEYLNARAKLRTGQRGELK